MSHDLAHPVVARIYDPITWAAERTVFAPHRADLVSNLDGVVLELGAGTGSMFPHVHRSRAQSSEFEYHAIEPDPYMRRRAQRRAAEMRFGVELCAARAEALPYARDSFDVVLGAMVFCSIEDPHQAISEVCRVLRPGGELRLFEHVASRGWRLHVQRAIQPVWRRIAAGCHPARETDRFVVDHSPLTAVRIERIEQGITPIRPFVKAWFRLPS